MAVHFAYPSPPTAVHQRQPATIAQLQARKAARAREESSQMMFKLALEDVRLSYALRAVAARLLAKGHEQMADEVHDLACAAALCPAATNS